MWGWRTSNKTKFEDSLTNKIEEGRWYSWKFAFKIWVTQIILKDASKEYLNCFWYLHIPKKIFKISRISQWHSKSIFIAISYEKLTQSFLLYFHCFEFWHNLSSDKFSHDISRLPVVFESAILLAFMTINQTSSLLIFYKL